MKHIKTYKLFESEEIDFVNDFFLEVKDMGFNVEINSKYGKIDIKVKKNLTDSEFEEELARPDFRAVNMGSFKLSLIKDTLLSVISYLTDSGYDLESVFCYGGDFNIGNRSNGELMDLDDFNDLTDDTFLSAVIIDFIKSKKYDFVNEVKYYLDLSESIKVLNDICYELKDEGLDYHIQPDNEIKVRMLSLVLNSKIEPRKLDFYLEIDTTGKLTDRVKRSGMFSAPEWFLEFLQRVDDYMTSLGFAVKYSVYHPYGWKPLNSIYELTEVSGLVRAVKLKFVNEKILESYK